VATERPVGTFPSEYRATVRVDRMIRRSRGVGSLFEVRIASAGAATLHGSVRSRSLAFPAPSLTFPCHQAGLRGLPHRTLPLSIGVINGLGLLQLSSPSELSLRAGCSPPPLGFVYFTPLRRLAHLVSTPGGPEAPFGRAMPIARSCSAFAVSHRPDGLLHLGVAGLLHPAAGHEVRRVSTSRRQLPPGGGSARPRGFPATLTPFEEFHSPAAVPRHRGLCPPAVTSRIAIASLRLSPPRLPLAGRPARPRQVEPDSVALTSAGAVLGLASPERARARRRPPGAPGRSRARVHPGFIRRFHPGLETETS
jgi:hypothetical protein